MTEHKITAYYRGIELPEELSSKLESWALDFWQNGVDAALDQPTATVTFEGCEELADWEKELLWEDEPELRAFEDGLGWKWFEVIRNGFRLGLDGSREDAQRSHQVHPLEAATQGLEWIKSNYGELTELNSDGSPRLRKIQAGGYEDTAFEVEPGRFIYSSTREDAEDVYTRNPGLAWPLSRAGEYTVVPEW